MFGVKIVFMSAFILLEKTITALLLYVFLSTQMSGSNGEA